ncbi:MAG TPA: hypothetical protein VMV10_19045 [Pirellulales bacterium]|nr:hypothetical protein [Pirellulales bacterium]
MWRTSSGERTLGGAEAALIRAVVAFVRDLLEQELEFSEPWISGVKLFDELLTSQKIALLAEVGEALLRDDVPCSPLDGVHEAVVGMLFETLHMLLECEIDAAQSSPDDDLATWRRLVLAAVRETDGDDGDLPDPHSCKMADWSVLVDVLDSFVLWDDDWDTPELVMDESPDFARTIKQRLSIRDDYYTAIAPDPTEEELTHARAVLRQIAKNTA